MEDSSHRHNMTTHGESILKLARELVRIPTRGGVDSPVAAAALIEEWLKRRSIPAVELRDSAGILHGVTARVFDLGPGPAYVLDAPLDTAGFGDETQWTVGTVSGDLRNGWLYGRGAGDSKTGISIFCHVAVCLAHESGLAGSLDLLFDADEHTGSFGGARAFFEGRPSPPSGVFIGYPGNERIQIGSRGFLRGVITVHGEAAHSGAGCRRGINAVERCADLALRLSNLDLAGNASPEFPLPPVLTVTAIDGGTGFSQVPDNCRLNIDIRLTPGFGLEGARGAIEEAVRSWEIASPAWAAGKLRATEIDWLPGLPAYRVSDENEMLRTLEDEARAVLGRPVPTGVAGPSNIGNYLATMGIASLCGFGVTARGIHAADECVEIGSMEAIAEIYFRTLRRLLSVRQTVRSPKDS